MSGSSGGYAARIEQMQQRVRTGVASGAISRQEAGPLRQQLRQANQLEMQYRADGWTAQERADLQDELRDIRQEIRLAEGGSATQERYPDRDYRDAQPRYDRDGNIIPESQPAQRQTLGGIIDGVIGGSKEPQ